VGGCHLLLCTALLKAVHDLELCRSKCAIENDHPLQPCFAIPRFLANEEEEAFADVLHAKGIEKGYKGGEGNRKEEDKFTKRSRELNNKANQQKCMRNTRQGDNYTSQSQGGRELRRIITGGREF
jgi:hypothetical protein